MKNKINVSLIIVLFVFIGCNQKPSDGGKTILSKEYADSLQQIVDSIRQVQKHLSRYGYHIHGVDPAVDAHQNLSAQRRVAKKTYILRDQKVKETLKAATARKKRREEYLRKREKK